MVTVEEAVTRDLFELGDLGTSALAATALVLARELDNPGNSATSKSMCARALNETLDKLRALAPSRDEEDRLDELSSRRSSRLAGKAAT